MDPQRLKDLRSNSCLLCHTPGCRPWKHGNKARVANMEIDEIPGNGRQVDDIEDSEN